MKPNGFEAAASMISHTSTPRSWHRHRQLVDQRDVDVPEGVLQQLGHLRGLRPLTGITCSTKPS
jgi:hypothetical protein